MIDCTIKVMPGIAISEVEFGRRLLNSLLRNFPDYEPQLYGKSESTLESFESKNIDAFLEGWGRTSLITRRNSPKVLMHVSFPGAASWSRHPSVNFIRFQLLEPSCFSALKKFVLEISELFVADYAMAHVLTSGELQDWFDCRLQRPTTWPQPPVEEIVARLRHKADKEGHAGVLWETEIANINSGKLEQCLPNLYWLNVFGVPYVEMFGRQKLLTTPAHVVEPLSYGGISLCLTQGLSDTGDAWDSFKSVREQCKAHLDSNVFCNQTGPKSHQYRTPKFVFSTPGKMN